MNFKIQNKINLLPYLINDIGFLGMCNRFRARRGRPIVLLVLQRQAKKLKCECTKNKEKYSDTCKKTNPLKNLMFLQNTHKKKNTDKNMLSKSHWSRLGPPFSLMTMYHINRFTWCNHQKSKSKSNKKHIRGYPKKTRENVMLQSIPKERYNSTYRMDRVCGPRCQMPGFQ